MKIKAVIELYVVKTVEVKFKDGTIIYKHFLDLGNEIVPLYSKFKEPKSIQIFSYKGSLKIRLVG